MHWREPTRIRPHRVSFCSSFYWHKRPRHQLNSSAFLVQIASEVLVLQPSNSSLRAAWWRLSQLPQLPRQIAGLLVSSDDRTLHGNRRENVPLFLHLFFRSHRHGPEEYHLNFSSRRSRADVDSDYIVLSGLSLHLADTATATVVTSGNLTIVSV